MLVLDLRHRIALKLGCPPRSVVKTRHPICKSVTRPYAMWVSDVYVTWDSSQRRDRTLAAWDAGMVHRVACGAWGRCREPGCRVRDGGIVARQGATHASVMRQSNHPT